MKTYQFLKNSFFEDSSSLSLFSASILSALVVFLVWHYLIAPNPDIFVYMRFGLYPLRYLVLMFFLNTIIGITAFKEDVNITRLMFSTNIFLALMVLILEFYYFKSIG